MRLPAILANERAQQGTTMGHCGSAETCPFSAMYGRHCPCSHEYSLGAANPVLPDLQLDLGDPVMELRAAVE
jgi:hypothetical protein